MNFKLNQSGTQSCYEVELGEDLTLLFSYKTLVAAMIRCGDSAKMKFFKVKNTSVSYTHLTLPPPPYV